MSSMEAKVLVTPTYEETWLKAVIRSLPMGIFLADKNGKILEVNDLIYQIWGGSLNTVPLANSPKEYSNFRGWWASTGEPLGSEDWALSKVLQTGKTITGEVIDIARFDGTRTTILNSASAVKDSEGNIIGAVVTNQDISYQRTIQHELLEARNNLEKLVSEKSKELQSFFDISLDILTIVGLDGYFKRVNSSLEKILGYSREELLSIRVVDLIHPDDIQITVKENLKILKGQPVTYYEIRFRSKDGAYKTIAWTAIPEPENSALYCVGRDITEQKENQARIYEILESISDAFYAIDKDWKITYANDEALRLVNVKIEDRNKAIGKKLWDIYPSLIDTELYDSLHKAMESRVSISFEVQSRRNGHWYENRAYPSPEGLTVFFKDITEKKETQLAKEQLAAIIESSDSAIISLDLKGFIQTWNKAAERIFGYSSEEVIGQNIEILTPEAFQGQHMILLKQIQMNLQILPLEVVRLRKDGSPIHLLLTLSTLRDRNGKSIGASALYKDITEQKETENKMARLEQLHLVGEMAAGISHEVRNPMTTVRGFLQILSQKDGRCSDYKDYFDLMIAEIDRANSIISDFLSLGKNQLSKLKTINLNTIITTVLPLLNSDAIRREQYIELELEEVPDTELDQKQILQVILNLARNGLEAMEKGKTLTIRTYSENNRVFLEIVDQGQGIPPEILEKLGTPFLTTKETGTGLGLAVCYSILQKHKATMTVKTGTSGTTFTISFDSN